MWPFTGSGNRCVIFKRHYMTLPGSVISLGFFGYRYVTLAGSEFTGWYFFYRYVTLQGQWYRWVIFWAMIFDPYRVRGFGVCFQATHMWPLQGQEFGASFQARYVTLPGQAWGVNRYSPQGRGNSCDFGFIWVTFQGSEFGGDMEIFGWDYLTLAGGSGIFGKINFSRFGVCIFIDMWPFQGQELAAWEIFCYRYVTLQGQAFQCTQILTIPDSGLIGYRYVTLHGQKFGASFSDDICDPSRVRVGGGRYFAIDMWPYRVGGSVWFRFL